MKWNWKYALLSNFIWFVILVVIGRTNIFPPDILGWMLIGGISLIWVYTLIIKFVPIKVEIVNDKKPLFPKDWYGYILVILIAFIIVNPLATLRPYTEAEFLAKILTWLLCVGLGIVGYRWARKEIKEGNPLMTKRDLKILLIGLFILGIIWLVMFLSF